MLEASPALSVTPDFEVTWRDPADAESSWLLDDAHYDRPVPHLAREVFSAIMGYVDRRTVFLNGYAFARNRGPTMPGPELEGRDVFEVWSKEYFPRVKAGCAEIRNRDYASMETSALAAELPALFARASELHYLTMSVVQMFLAPTMALLEFCGEHLGEDASALAPMVFQGAENETSASAVALGKLAEHARAHAGVAAAVKSGDLASLTGVEGGPEFQRMLNEFLDTYGWRAERWSALHIPTWAESPAVPLRLIARFLEAPANSPLATLKGASEGKTEAIDIIESRLTPEDVTKFRDLVAHCTRHVPMSEERTFCQLLIWGSLRVPIMELGRRLHATGIIETPNDVAYLSSDEISAAAANASLRYSALVAQRKVDLEAYWKLTPPLHVGAPAAARTLNTAQKLFVRHFRGPDERLHQEGRTLRGLAASRGVVRAPARVIRDLAEADRLQPGEVLVCGTTSAPWTPLFAIAGAVVTDAGGVLAHSAICAREYGIPCIVGTSVGTRMIPDGAMISVDGTSGIVEIEDS